MSRYSNQKGRYCGMCVSLLISRVGRSDCGKGKRGDNQVKQIPPIPPSPPEAIQSLSCGKIFCEDKIMHFPNPHTQGLPLRILSFTADVGNIR